MNFDIYPQHTRLYARLRKIAKSYGTRLYLSSKLEEDEGQYDIYSRNIWVATGLDTRTTISAFFHELAHFLDHKDGLFSRFYNSSSPMYVNRFLALRAERHTDKRGQVLCKRYFPKIRYKKAYISKEDIQYLKDQYQDGRLRNAKIRQKST
jgi:hypothetical protein